MDLQIGDAVSVKGYVLGLSDTLYPNRIRVSFFPFVAAVDRDMIIAKIPKPFAPNDDAILHGRLVRIKHVMDSKAWVITSTSHDDIVYLSELSPA